MATECMMKVMNTSSITRNRVYRSLNSKGFVDSSSKSTFKRPVCMKPSLPFLSAGIYNLGLSMF